MTVLTYWDRFSELCVSQQEGGA